ncbi:M14 family zinc carboxypeptidase [Thalassolituus sp. LLYu03]|uniref:M14 family metallopeptidase n=1 Tax=Thalassolituus sp. LLYu03 TaxID=3421656 RepID=UPI003D27F424
MIQRISPITTALPELIQLEELIDQGRQHLRINVPLHITLGEHKLPFYVLEMGSTEPLAPTLALIGGVHGVERIGTQVILSFLKSLLTRLEWDPVATDMLSQMRLMLIPIVNPGGMWANSRSNPQGIDLMRNAPVEADERPPFLVGGQRISRHLPWFRGRRGESMASESQALVDSIRTTLMSQRHCISLDCHSGFGYKDRIWFPWAKSVEPFPGVADAYALTRLFERTYPNHSVYLFEPQAHSYTTHGDLWDFLYEEYRQAQPEGLYLPLTLEMGSWLWVKKNPGHLFRYHSLFNPILPHRHQRILRRHFTLFEFLMSAVRSMPVWSPEGELPRLTAKQEALERWYPGRLTSRG